MTVVDEASGQVITTIAVRRCPERIVYYPERREMYVSNFADNTISVIDVDTDTVTATIPVGVVPCRLVVCRAMNGRDEVWVLNGSSWHIHRVPPLTFGGEISVISGAEHRVVVVGTIKVANHPANWLFRNGHAYVVSSTERELDIIDVKEGKVVGWGRLDHDPAAAKFGALAYSRSGNLFLANGDNTVTICRVD